MLTPLLFAVALAGTSDHSLELAGPGFDRDGPNAIINGEPASEDDYPMAGAILVEINIKLGGNNVYPVRTIICSSTLIAPDVVLAAAHCIDPVVLAQAMRIQQNQIDSLVFVWTRQADLSAKFANPAAGGFNPPAWPDDAIDVRETVFHPDWKATSLSMGVGQSSDISLLFLDSEVLDVPFARLANADEAAEVVDGAVVQIVGWGQQEATNQGEQPAAGTIGIKMMGESTLAEVGEAEMWVGPNEEDVRKCHGDSGGPTFLNVTTEIEDDLRVIGVTSHSYDFTDCKQKGGVDTRVDYYLDWIDQEMTARCDDGSRVWCEVPGIIGTDWPPVEEPELDDPMASPEEEKGGCGCASSGTGMVGLLPLLLGLLGLRRRH